jgi:hypothetical protein
MTEFEVKKLRVGKGRKRNFIMSIILGNSFTNRVRKSLIMKDVSKKNFFFVPRSPLKEQFTKVHILVDFPGPSGPIARRG